MIDLERCTETPDRRHRWEDLGPEDQDDVVCIFCDAKGVVSVTEPG